jgi:hypothetical protein
METIESMKGVELRVDKGNPDNPVKPIKIGIVPVNLRTKRELRGALSIYRRFLSDLEYGDYDEDDLSMEGGVIRKSVCVTPPVCRKHIAWLKKEIIRLEGIKVLLKD